MSNVETEIPIPNGFEAYDPEELVFVPSLLDPATMQQCFMLSQPVDAASCGAVENLVFMLVTKQEDVATKFAITLMAAAIGHGIIGIPTAEACQLDAVKEIAKANKMGGVMVLSATEPLPRFYYV